MTSLARASSNYSDKPILSSERMLRRDYNRKGSVKKLMVVGLKGLDAKTNLLAVNRQS
jgi:hypothetical protein